LPIPQDRIFRLSGGQIEEITVEVDVKARRIVMIQPQPQHRLFVEFDDGVSGSIDVVAQLGGATVHGLQDEVLFRQVAIDDFGAVRWVSGAALAPDLLYQCLTSRPDLPPKLR
jgi:hypothetical protein